MRIRKAIPEDVAVLKRVVEEARQWLGHPTHWVGLVDSDLSISEESINRKEIYVAEDSNTLLGFYVLSENRLEELWIAPAYFGSGVGKELFLHAKEGPAHPEPA